MELTQNRIEMMNTLYKSKMRIEITDKMTGANSNGTQVKIMLPLH
jgi:hypothetical protein